MMSLQQLLPDWTLSAAASCQVSGLCLDSRRVRDGDLFLALSGGARDGRGFVDAAIHAGAAAVLMESEHFSEAMQGGVPMIGVPSLGAQLGELAGRFHGYPARDLTVLGVTGTNGKSSVAWFLRDALNAAGMPCGLIGTLGARFADYEHDTGHTTPDVLTLHEVLAAFRDRGARYVAMEVSSHALTQHRLDGVSVHTAAFTNLSHDHLDYHGDMDSYFVAKRRLFEGRELAAAAINVADSYGVRLANELGPHIRCVRVGGEQADVGLRRLHQHAAGMDLALAIADDVISLQLPLYGRFNVDNLMVVAGMLALQGLDAGRIGAALAAVTPVPGRMQPVREGDGPVVLVDYAHTPDGLEKALLAVRDHFSGTVWCLFGCGGNRDAGKRPMMAAVAERLADRLVLTSDNPRAESPTDILNDMLAGLRQPTAADVIVDRPAAVRHAVNLAQPGDVILLAGKGHERWQEIGGKRLAMDDCELARDALRARRGGAA